MKKKNILIIMTAFMLPFSAVTVSGTENSLLTDSISDPFSAVTDSSGSGNSLTSGLELPETETLSICSRIYPLLENKLFENTLPYIQEFYEAYTESLSGHSEDAKLTSFSLELTPASRVILRLALPFDISWMNTLDIYALTGVSDNVETDIEEIYANDHKLFTSEYYFDIKSQTEYTRVPEISQNYLKTDYLALYSAYGYDYSVTETDEETISARWPDSSILGDILLPYVSVFLEDFDNITLDREVLSVEGVETECHTYMAQLTQEETVSLIFELLRTLRDDRQLKQFFDGYYGNEADGEYFYEYFLDDLNFLIEELHSDHAPEMDFSLSSKIWLTKDNTLVGRQLSMEKEGEIIPLFTCFAPSENDTCGIFVNIGNTENSYGVSGKIDYSNSEMNGTLRCLIDDAPFFTLDISDFDYDAEYDSDCELKGSFALTMHSGSKEVPLYNPYANFDLSAELSGTVENSEIKLSVNSANVPLVNAIIRMAPAKPEIIPALPDFSAALDSLSDHDMNIYSKEADWSTLIRNCENAAIPEAAIEQIGSYIEYFMFYGQSFL